jgi:large subunit ribosomal protein L5
VNDVGKNDAAANSMRAIKIEKVTLNIGCGDDKQKIERAVKLLELITGKKPLVTKSKRRSTFGVPKGKPIGAMVTLRGEDATQLLKNVFEAKDKKIDPRQFGRDGNFSIGVKEYIDLPNVKYNHEIGMMGFDVTVTLSRAGFRISKRRIRQTKIPAKHKINKEESMEWLKNSFKGVEIVEQE